MELIRSVLLTGGPNPTQLSSGDAGAKEREQAFHYFEEAAPPPLQDGAQLHMVMCNVLFPYHNDSTWLPVHS